MEALLLGIGACLYVVVVVASLNLYLSADKVPARNRKRRR